MTGSPFHFMHATTRETTRENLENNTVHKEIRDPSMNPLQVANNTRRPKLHINNPFSSLVVASITNKKKQHTNSKGTKKIRLGFSNSFAMESYGEEFKVGSCDGQKTIQGNEIPLVLHPKEFKDINSLLSSLEKNKEWFEEKLIEHSAILLRGFDVANAVDFNDVIEIIGWDDIRYVGPAPRTHIHKRVWTANEGPLSEFIYYHHEMVLIKEFPKKVILFCEVPPPEGGETPFVPSFRVTERMQEEFPDAVKEMEEKGLRYSFTALSKDDTSSMRGRGWEDAFGTSDPLVAEQRAKALGMEMEWLPNGAVKTVLGPRSLTRVFPDRKGRRMWFNTVVGMHGKEHSSAEMADGSEIPASVVKRCGEIIEEESIQFKWEKGDILFLDNLALLHGRRPSMPPRKVLVATCK